MSEKQNNYVFSQEAILSNLSKCDCISNETLRLYDPEKPDYSVSLLTDTDIKYQDFEYTLVTRGRAVYWNEHKKIDLSLALQELENLDCTLHQNGISIINCNSDENIFCHRVNENNWWVLTPIQLRGVFTGIKLSASAETGTLIDSLKLFFEEISWLEGLTWKKIKWNCDDGSEVNFD